MNKVILSYIKQFMQTTGLPNNNYHAIGNVHVCARNEVLHPVQRHIPDALSSFRIPMPLALQWMLRDVITAAYDNTSRSGADEAPTTMQGSVVPSVTRPMKTSDTGAPLTSYNTDRVQNVVNKEAVLVFTSDILSMRVDAQWKTDFTSLLSVNNDACGARYCELLRFIELNYTFIRRVAAMQHILQNDTTDADGAVVTDDANNDSDRHGHSSNSSDSSNSRSHQVIQKGMKTLVDGISREEFAVCLFSPFIKTIHAYNEKLPRTHVKCTALEHISVIKELLLHIYETLTTPLMQKLPHIELIIDSSNAYAKGLDVQRQ
jgi:hypothetical protein